MFQTPEIATALTQAWIRNGVPNKTPKEVSDFYCALYNALEETQSNKIPKVRSRDVAIHLTCAGLLPLFVAMWVLLAMFCKRAAHLPLKDFITSLNPVTLPR
jgi:hypothetical protein